MEHAGDVAILIANLSHLPMPSAIGEVRDATGTGCSMRSYIR